MDPANFINFGLKHPETLPDTLRNSGSQAWRDPAVQASYRKGTKEYNLLRRYYYHLGIATAKEYLEILRRRQAEAMQ